MSIERIDPASPGAEGEDRIRGCFWGVRGSIPTPGSSSHAIGGNTSCLELQLPGGEIVILDAGTGIRLLGAALAARHAPLELHLFLTHFHWDHLQGLPFFQPLYGSRNVLTFYSSEPPERTRHLLQQLMCSPFFPVDFAALESHHEFREVPAAGLQLGAVEICSIPLHHPQGSHGYVFTHAGRKLVFATDVEHGEPVSDRALREAAEGADVLILDAQFTPEEYPQRRGTGHGTWQDATRLAREAGVRKLFLFHHDPGHSDEALHAILAEARNEFAETFLAAEGDSFLV